MHAELLLDVGAELGEGPLWDEQNKQLYWVDISGKRMHRYDVRSNHDSSRTFDQMVGMVCLTTSGEPLVALEKELRILHGQEEETIVSHVEDSLKDNRFNDGKCDAAGRLWIGTMNKRSRRGTAAFYRIYPSGECMRMFGDVTISNGIGWSPDNTFLYYIDTPSGILWRFDFDLGTGTIENRIPLIDYHDEPGSFDGMAVDAEGTLWCCHWEGFCVTQWDPYTGRKLRSIPIPVPNVTCCCFGGDKMDQLFITTGTGTDNKREYPASGSLYVCETDTHGLAANRFGH